MSPKILPMHRGQWRRGFIFDVTSPKVYAAHTGWIISSLGGIG